MARSCIYSPKPGIGLSQNLAHLFVGCLRKVFIPLADAAELFRHDHGHDLIGCALHFVIGCWRDGRRGDNDAAAFNLRSAATAATIVEPVAMPSSAMITVFPATSGAGDRLDKPAHGA